MPRPSTLTRSVSPPKICRRASKEPSNNTAEGIQPSLAAVEAGQAKVQNHLNFFAAHLSAVTRPEPVLSIEDFKSLYTRNQHPHGRHFVVHQHDHPISGVHYDLRLQFSETSTISFAVPYGLPGNPNSVRPNRMAIETRVHCLWNNLIESASHATGSLLIWDTGEYEILPRKQQKLQTTDDELSEIDNDLAADDTTDSERLFSGFRSRHIRIRLHGQKLPPGYTIALRLPSANDRLRAPRRPIRKRRRIDPAIIKAVNHDVMDSQGEDELEAISSPADSAIEEAAAVASDDDEDAAIRANNAYSGAHNSIGSIHQRNWFLTLDRRNSGFRKARGGPDEGRWVGNWSAFFVRGRDHERSIVTGRSADQVMEDANVARFIGRKMWRAILE